MTLTTEATDPPSLWWLTPLIAALTLLLGSGGIVAYRRLRLDRKLGVAAAEVAEDDAIAARWQKIIEAQTASLVEPLRARLAEVTADVTRCEDEQKAMEVAMALERRKYRRAIGYVRTVLAWIKTQAPSLAEPPPPPADIAEDI